MPRFNYKKARAGGMSAEEIVQFLDSEAAEGRVYDIDPSAYGAMRAARKIQVMGNLQAGAVAPPFYLDPIEAAGALAGGGKGAFQAGMGTAEAVASRLAGRAAPKAMEAGATRELLEAGGELVGGIPGLAARVSRMFRGRPAAPSGLPMPPGATAVPAPAASALPGGFSAPISTASQGLPEAVGSRIAAGAGSGARAAPNPASEAGRSLARQRWAKAKPEPKGAEKAKIVKLPQPVKRRIAAAKRAEKPRHEVQYFSKSKGEYINIEDMNQKHIEQAYRQLAKTNPKPGSVAAKVMDALLDEAKHRLTTTGIHIGQ